MKTLGLRGAAKLLKCHPETLRQKLKSGEILAAKVGRRRVIMERDIESYLRSLHNPSRRTVQTQRSKESVPCQSLNAVLRTTYPIYTRDGRRIKQSARTSDRRLAQQFHDELKAKAWKEDYTDEKPNRTWDVCAVAYLTASQHKATFSTIQMHVKKLRTYLGDCLLKDITPDVVEEIKARRLSEGVAHGTVNRMLEILRAMLNMAVDREWLAKAPKVQMLPEPESRPRWLTYEEEARLLAELPEHLRAMMRFSLSTGLRQRNVVNLRWDQIDLDRKCAWIYGDQSKTGQPIAVALNSAAMAVLQDQPRVHECVFTYKGRPVTRCNNTAWKKALTRAGVQNFTWHNLRSTWASRHVMSGTSVFDLQHLGGWSSQAMIQCYAALSAEHLAEASENVVRDGPNTVPTETVLRTLH